MALAASRFQSVLRAARGNSWSLRTCRQTQRSFSVTPIWQLHTKEMNEELLAGLKVNQGRLMEDIHHTCQWGSGQRWGEYVVPYCLYFLVLNSCCMLTIQTANPQKLACPASPFPTPINKPAIGSSRLRKPSVARPLSTLWETYLPSGQD